MLGLTVLLLSLIGYVCLLLWSLRLEFTNDQFALRTLYHPFI